MLEELLSFINFNFTVDPATGKVTKPDGRLLTACKFNTLPLTAKEVVWAYATRQLPVGIMLINPDKPTHRFALSNLEKYDESEEIRKVYRTRTGFLLAWKYLEKKPPVLVELAEYQAITSIISISPMNYRYNETGLSEEERQRFALCKTALHRTNLIENSYWRVMTDSLVLVKGSQEMRLGRWANHARRLQTYSHKERQAKIRDFTQVRVASLRVNKKIGRYAQERIALSRQIITSRSEEKNRQSKASLRHTAKDSPILRYIEEEAVPSMQKEAYLRDMARWIADNSY